MCLYSQTGQNLLVKTRTVNNPTRGVWGGRSPPLGSAKTTHDSTLTEVPRNCYSRWKIRKITHVATAEHKMQPSSYNKTEVSYNVPAARAAFLINKNIVSFFFSTVFSYWFCVFFFTHGLCKFSDMRVSWPLLELPPGPLVHYFSNQLTDSFFRWRFGTAWPLAFISGVGEKNRVIRSELIGRSNLFGRVSKKGQRKFGWKKTKLYQPE